MRSVTAVPPGSGPGPAPPGSGPAPPGSGPAPPCSGPGSAPAGFRPAVLSAVLERVTYANEETGYTVARVATDRGQDLLTVVGALLGAQPGESLRLVGRWSSHPRYGRQFEVESYTTVLPATIQGIQRYLGSGLVKGIGPVFAERIVDHFGLDTLRVIEEEPGRLVEVAGLGPKRTARITAAWEEQKAIKEVMIFLQGVGVSTSLAVRIYKQYRDASISVVKNEPYRLAADVWGIGFKTADTIARAVGIPHDSPDRVKAGLGYALSAAADSGHCFLPEPQLVAEAGRLLEVPAPLVETCLAELVAAEGVVREPVPGPDARPVPAVYLVPFHRAERSLAGSLRRLRDDPADRLPDFATVDWGRALTWLRSRTGTDLAPEQQEAVRLALTSKVAVLTGGPGCGKSFTVRSVVTLALAKRAKVTLVAPTGRAAKRLAELTGHPAATVHRLLQLRPGGDASFDRDRPLDTDLLVVDEASMLDLILANKLVKAVPPGAHLLLVGDVDQLPSVGAGEVLRDLLAAPAIPRVRLQRIFRQAQQSGVVTNAHRINSGRPPVTTGLADFFRFACDEAEAAAALTAEVVAERIPARFGLDPRRDVQVLAPMHRGAAGAGALNALLQQRLTPAVEGRPERRSGGRVFRVGDKVTQLRNNYDKGAAGVFNGTLGVVTALAPEEQTLTVRTDEDELVDYGFDELDELAHAYAVTIHRSQGSEYPAVVIPLTMSAWMMLRRDLLYTAVTRARRLVVLVGSDRAVAAAVRTTGAGRRHTALAHRPAVVRRRGGTTVRAIVAGVHKGDQTRQVVLERATEIAARLGLAGLTIGSLAHSAGLSKSGLYAHFLSKEDLQLATLQHAREQFVDLVLRPALSAPRGEPRVRELFERWLGRSREQLPACCLYLSAKVEFAGQPGRVREQLARDYRDLLDSIGLMVRAGVAEGQFRPDADPARFAQELDGIILGFFFAHRLLGDPATERRARDGFEVALARIRA